MDASGETILDKIVENIHKLVVGLVVRCDVEHKKKSIILLTQYIKIKLIIAYNEN